MSTPKLALIPVGLLAAGLSTTAPTTTRYVLETSIEQVQDLTAFGQGEQKLTIVQAAQITVTLQDTSGARTMHVVVDSVAAEGAMAPPSAVLTGVKGAWVHGLLDPENRASELRSSNDTSEVLSQLKATLQTFHPRLKPGGFKPGEVWTDTTSVEAISPAGRNKTTVITTYTAGQEEPVDGHRARRIEASFSSVSSGKLNNPMAGELDLTAEEAGTGVYYVAVDGRYLGGSSTASGKATVTSAGLPGPIPIKTSRTSRVAVRR